MKLVHNRDKHNELQLETSPFKFIRKEFPILENLLEFYMKSNGATKNKILSTIFANKLVLGKGKVVNPVFIWSIQLILWISGVLRSSEEKEEVNFDHSIVATLPKNPIFKI